MSHNITTRDGSFTVREPAWHGLSEVLPDYPTREQAQAIAHPWEPVSEPVYRAVPTVTDDGTLEVEYKQIEGTKAIVRSDDGHTIGVVNDTFEPVSNNEMYDIAEAIEGDDPTTVKYETGGSLKGGSKVWLLLRLREPITFNDDPLGPTIPYYALQNSHDGSGAFRGQSLMTRIVCDNTARMADLEAQGRGTEFVFRHTKNVRERIEQAQMALAGWRDSIGRYQALMNHLLTEYVTDGQREVFVERFIPMPPPHMVSDRVVNNVEQARSALRGIYSSVTVQDTAHTAYGLVQGAIEYGEHFRAARSKESRFKRAYLDPSVITSDALALAQTVIGVDA